MQAKPYHQPTETYIFVCFPGEKSLNIKTCHHSFAFQTLLFAFCLVVQLKYIREGKNL
jgi:hypothetical protein